MRTYRCLKKQVYRSGDYALVPIRHEDRYDIMKWRNEQIYHLRQAKPLTEEDQDRYFNEVVAGLFEQEQPAQLLFSLLKGEECIGYGGLVHINWVDRNAEISFLLNPLLDNDNREKFWVVFLGLVEKIAFDQLVFEKIYTYAFDLRPYLYDIFESNDFVKSARLLNHKLVDGRYCDVIIHEKIKDHE